VVTPGEIYAAVITILLLVALAVAIPVLKQIVVDGIERRRKWQSGEMERYTEDEEYNSGPPAALDDESAPQTRLNCRHCGAENDPAFTYCSECVEPL
jgi:hypothetical protein